MILHIITQPPSHTSSINDCLKVASNQDAILFIEDGVYCALDPVLTEKIRQGHIANVYCLAPDLNARGVRAPAYFQTIDYAGFVELTATYQCSQTWS